MKSFLIISLDFELHWGRFDKIDLQGSLDHYRRTRENIPNILDQFHQHGIHATWATVGSLMASDEEEWRFYWPKLKPSYDNQKFSAYSWFESLKPIWKETLFAPDLVQSIIDCPGQELGSHTFAHYYTMEVGQQKEEFREDLRAAKRIVKEKFGKKLTSLVYPRNQMDKNALEVAFQEGFQTVRTNPGDWYWKETQVESLFKSLFRTVDTLYPLGRRTTYSLPKRTEGELLQIPASRILRPFRKNSFFNKRRIERIKEEMEFAAKSNEAYHLWWHPHNFGKFPEENLECLNEILTHFNRLEKEYGMQSIAMGEVK